MHGKQNFNYTFLYFVLPPWTYPNFVDKKYNLLQSDMNKSNCCFVIVVIVVYIKLIQAELHSLNQKEKVDLHSTKPTTELIENVFCIFAFICSQMELKSVPIVR